MTERDSPSRSLAATLPGRFVRARLDGVTLPDYPGELPVSLSAAYAVQDLAIGQWPDEVRGWKVGRIVEPWLSRVGAERLVGPIFARGIRSAYAQGAVRFPVLRGGFAAVEAEFVVQLSADAPSGKTSWAAQEAGELAGALHVGVEVAGSPLATINELGPLAVVSDFGNNMGLIVGPAVQGWRHRRPDELVSETFVEGRSVGHGTAASVPGGPLAALAFALGCCAKRGLPMKAGSFVSTGATTGIHEIKPGESATVMFGDGGEIRCLAVAGPC
jgi:2-keto-4-pentenoate hydratase